MNKNVGAAAATAGVPMHRLPVTTTILEHELSQVRLLLERETGMLLDIPNEILCDKFTEFVESQGAPSASHYIETLRNSEVEREKLAESLLPGQTRFFRHPAMFQAFVKLAIPELEVRKHNARTMRVWSAGCSTGQEAYSIAMSLCEALKGGKDGWNLRIIATDIRAGALQEAERGLYSESELQSLPEDFRQTYFARIGQHFLVKPRLRNLVTFTRANLVKHAYIGRYDCIFCMDVLPHFSATQRMAVVEKLHLYLEPGGFLFLGQGERLPATNVVFRWQNYCDCVIYQRPIAAAAASGH